MDIDYKMTLGKVFTFMEGLKIQQSFFIRITQTQEFRQPLWGDVMARGTLEDCSILLKELRTLKHLMNY